MRCIPPLRYGCASAMHSAMSRLVRSTALVAGVLALQLGALGDGAVCAVAARHSVQMGDPMGMTDMGAANYRGATTSSEPAGRAATPAHSAPAKSPCGSGGMPSGCRMFAPCAPLFVPAMTTRRVAPTSPLDRNLALAERVPSGPARAPEPPPPRA